MDGKHIYDITAVTAGKPGAVEFLDATLRAVGVTRWHFNEKGEVVLDATGRMN